MKNQKIKELRLSVGTSPANMPFVNKGNPIGTVFNTNADDVFSKRYSLVNEEEESEDEGEEMPESILEYRVSINGKYQLLETLERIDEGFFQKIADLAKAVPGLDQIVGDIELYMQAGKVKEAFDGLENIVSSLKHTAGLTALSIIGTVEQYSSLLQNFILADEKDKSLLKEGVEKILEVLKQMTITAAQTFDSVVALPTFAAAGVGGIAGEAITNVVTSLGTFLRDQPVEQFVFKTITNREGIISKIVELFEKVMTLVTGKGMLADSLGYIVEKISTTGGEIVRLFLNKPFELLRRLGDLYKAAIGEPIENIESANVIDIEQMNIDNNNKAAENTISAVYESKKYSLLSLIESFNEEITSEKKGFTDKYDDHNKLKGKQKKGLPDHLQKAIINSKKNEVNNDEEVDEEDSFEEIDLEEFSGAGAAGGYALPLGASNKSASKQKDHHKILEKQINEQRERIALLQAFHQKTTNKLK
jgi:hypothetical protein